MFDIEENSIYILSNKQDEKLGFFVLKIDLDDKDPTNGKFLIKWKKKLDIGDANFFILRNPTLKFKEIVISYKTIYVNVYNILVLDLIHKSK